MQSQITLSLITRGRIVITVVFFLTVPLLSGCGERGGAVFTDTEYASGENFLANGDRSSYWPDADPGEENHSEKSAANAGTRTDPPVNEPERICVFVCGAVNREGVYELPEGARVIDAVEAAGGFSEDADTAYVNQAEFVRDAQKLRIPGREETASPDFILQESAEAEERPDPGLVNINTADLDELMTIPGIGQSKAMSILAYREEHGKFGSAEEIMNVKGIGRGVYEKMKDHISVY